MSGYYIKYIQCQCCHMLCLIMMFLFVVQQCSFKPFLPNIACTQQGSSVYICGLGKNGLREIQSHPRKLGGVNCCCYFYGWESRLEQFSKVTPGSVSSPVAYLVHPSNLLACRNKPSETSSHLWFMWQYKYHGAYFLAQATLMLMSISIIHNLHL